MRLILLLGLSFLIPAAPQQNALREAARLDGEGKCADAERIYLAELAKPSPPPALLNNAGNHYLACGAPEKAESYFLRIVRSNPAHPNANLQLARIAADRRQGMQALAYLAHITGQEPEIRLLRAEALHWAGKQADSTSLLKSLAKETAGDPRLAFLFGLTCGKLGDYEQAEEAFNSVLSVHPDDFETLLNLGRAAARAGHPDRAQRALDVALKLKPGSVDALVEMAEAGTLNKDYARAVYYLAKARQLEPQKPGLALALARAAQAGEYYGDAVLVYDQYLTLNPSDDSARRDRALMCGYIEARKAEGLKELGAYIQKHPEDPLGHFDWALLVWRDEPDQALASMARASRLDPRLGAAHVSRAWLLNRAGRAEEAVPELQKAIETDSRDFRAMSQLGETYRSLDRPADAERILRRAVAIAPEDPDILLQIGRSLMDLGREEEGRQYLKKFESIRPQRARGPWSQAGMIESATLSSEDRIRREIERLRHDAAAHPDDPELQLRFASLLITDGRTTEAITEFRVLLTRNAEDRIWEEAGTFLLNSRQYGLAREFLERAVTTRPAARLDLALVLLFLESPAKALEALEPTPVAEQSGDYLLLKASILDAAGQTSQADQTLEHGLSLSISRPQIAQQAVLLLLRRQRYELALDLLAKVAGSNPELRLTRAIVLGLMQRTADAERDLHQIESQYPEWDRPYVAHGLVLEKRQPREAARKLQTAIALGTQEPAAACGLARLQTSPAQSQCACANGLQELLFPVCGRP